MAVALDLGPFLEELACRLDGMDAADLRYALVEHARALPPAQRQAFLDVFSAAPCRRDPSDGWQAVDGGSDETLQIEVDAFVARVGEGAFFEGWEYDSRTWTYDAVGDDSWVDELEDLVSRADARFLTGDLAGARAAYGPLLRTFTLDEVYSAYEDESPESMLDSVDLTETKARYLRSLYETVPIQDRAETLLAAMDELCYVGSHVGLVHIASARPEPLQDIAAHLPRWVATLEATLSSSPGVGGGHEELAGEAAELLDGPSGLVDLARRRGSTSPNLWLRAARRVRRSPSTDARSVCAEGLDALVATSDGAAADGRVAAVLADLLAELAADDTDADAVLDARHRAWTLRPTQVRLLHLVDAADTLDRRAEIIATEAKRLSNRPNPRRSVTPASAWNSTDRLSAVLLVLNEDIDAAIALARSQDALGWSRDSNAATFVVPALLAITSATRATQPPDQPTLAETLARAACEPPLQDHRSVPFTADPPAPEPRTDLHTLLTGVAEKLKQHEPGTLERWLAAATELVDRGVDAIVTGQHRGVYGRAATLVVATAEVTATRTSMAQATTLVTNAAHRYPRHSAFQRELRAAISASSTLANTSTDTMPR